MSGRAVSVRDSAYHRRDGEPLLARCPGGRYRRQRGVLLQRRVPSAVAARRPPAMGATAREASADYRNTLSVKTGPWFISYGIAFFLLSPTKDGNSGVFSLFSYMRKARTERLLVTFKLASETSIIFYTHPFPHLKAAIRQGFHGKWVAEIERNPDLISFSLSFSMS